MKKIKVLIKYYIILICVFQSADSKGNSFSNLLNQFISNATSIESLNKMYVVMEDTPKSVISVPDDNYIVFSIALNDTIEFDKIVNLINSSDYDKNIWKKSAIYLVCKSIIKENRYKNQDIKIKLVENALQNSESVYGNIYSDLKYLNRSFFSAKSISRISDVINLGLNDDEVFLKCLMYNKNLLSLADTSFNKKLLKQLKDCSKASNLSMEQCLDSLNNGIVLSYKNYLNQNYTINTELIFLIGNALLDELASDLYHLMNRNPSNESLNDNIRLVLCRLNYKDFTDNYLMEKSDFVKNDSANVLKIERELFYINNQKSLFYLSRFLNVDIKVPCDMSNENAKSEKYGYYLIYKFSKIIINSPQQFKPIDNEFILSFCDVINTYAKNALLDFERWMESNKGKYIIDRELFKF